MQNHKYVCNECYKIQGESCNKECRCEVDGESPNKPTVCILSKEGLCKWRCTHENMVLYTFKDAETSLEGGDIWWLTGMHKCTSCGYIRQGYTSKYKLTKV